MNSQVLQQIVLKFLGSSLGNLIKAATVGLMLEGAFYGLIVANVLKYYTIFAESDSWLPMLYVGLGFIACTAQLVLTTYQVTQLYGSQFEFSAWLFRDGACNMCVILWIALANGAATLYFIHKALVLLGRKTLYVVIPLAGSLVSTVFGLVTVGKGWTMPKLKSDGSNLTELAVWFHEEEQVAKPWAIIAVTVNVVVCCLMMVVYLTSRKAFEKAQQTTLRKALMLTTETMFSPLFIVIPMMVLFEVKGVTLMGWDRTCVMNLGPSLYFSVLYSLVSRQKIATIVFGSSQGFETYNPTLRTWGPTNQQLTQLSTLHLATDIASPYADGPLEHTVTFHPSTITRSIKEENQLDGDIESTKAVLNLRDVESQIKSSNSNFGVAGVEGSRSSEKRTSKIPFSRKRVMSIDRWSGRSGPDDSPNSSGVPRTPPDAYSPYVEYQYTPSPQMSPYGYALQPIPARKSLPRERGGSS